MRAGNLRHRGTVQSQTHADDGRGGKVRGAWSAVSGMSRIPCEVVPLSGDERINAGAVQSDVTYTVRMRYRTGVKANMRLVWHANDGDRNLHFTGAPAIVGNYDGLEIPAREDAD